MSAALDHSPGIAAAERCKPYMDKARSSFFEACKKIGEEYAALPDNEKAVFRNELQLHKRTITRYAQIAGDGEKKLAIMSRGAGAGTLQIPPSVDVWSEIVATDDDTLKQASKAGLFTDYEVTSRTVRHFKRSGALPAVKKAERKTPTPLSEIRGQIQQAEKAMNTAIGHVSRARGLMEKHDISDIKGPEITLFRKRFEVLCAEIAAANPNLLDRALKVMRGEQ